MRIGLLGDRRIAWEVLMLINSSEFSSFFEVPLIVSDEKFYHHYCERFPQHSARFISNAERHDEKILEAIQSEAIEILFSVQYNWILPKAIIDSVSGMAFNIHNAKLPEYQGFHSITHALLNREKEYESTLHWMVDRVDSGDIAYRELTKIEPNDTALSLYLRTIPAAVNTAHRFLTDLRNGHAIPRESLTLSQGNFYSKAAIREFLDVTSVQDPIEIARIIRAVFFPPYNMAYRIIQGQKFLLAPAEDHQSWFKMKSHPNEPRYDLRSESDE